MDDHKSQYKEEQTHTLTEIQSAMSGKIIPLNAYRGNSGPAGDDLSSLERSIEKPQITPNRLRIGRLSILDCGHGWIKIELICQDHDIEAELLPPREVAVLKDWIKNN